MPYCRTFLFFLLTAITCHAQRHVIDSLEQVLPGMKEDTSKVKTINLLSTAYKNAGSFDTGTTKASDAIALARKIRSAYFEAAAFLTRGQSYDLSGKFPDALSDYAVSLRINDSICKAHPQKDYLHYAARKSLAATYGNIGIIYQTQGSLDSAMNNQLADLKIAEELNDTRLLGNAYNNLGTVYTAQQQLQLALNSFEKALEYKTKLGNNKGIASTYSNIGSIYTLKGDSCKANSPEQKSFYQLAMDNFSKSLKMYEDMGIPGGVIANKIGMAQLYQHSEPAHAKKLLLEALEPAQQMGYLDGLKSCYSSLYKTDSILGNFEEAYAYLKQYVSIRDTMNSQASARKILGEQLQHEFDKKQAKKKADQQQREAVDAEENRKAKIIFWAIAAGSLLVLVFAVFVVRSYRQKQRDNVAISLQKYQIEEKQKSILDSIRYAKRIQTSLLPNENVMERKLNELKSDQ